MLAPLILLYGAAALGLALATGTTDQLYLATYLDRFFEAGVALAFGYFLWCLHRAGKTARAGRRLPALGRELKAGLLRRQRLAVALPLLAVFPVVMALYSSVKRMIPAIRPFDLDPLWARLDAWLHGGVQPWELLQPLLGAPQQVTVHQSRRDVECRGDQGLKAQLRRHLCQNAVRIQSEYRTEYRTERRQRRQRRHLHLLAVLLGDERHAEVQGLALLREGPVIAGPDRVGL